jgi:Asp-tRNA(Asn)/Glu-tRNA(Gln) amidotransferase A subunit family amidase
MFNILAGYDPADPFTEAGRGKRADDYTDFLDVGALKGARFGVPREFVDHDDADPEITALFDAALDDLRAAGAEVIDPFAVPNMDAHINADNFCASFRYDMAEYLKTLGENAPITDVKQALDGGLYGPDAKSGLEELTVFPADKAPEDWDEPCLTFFNNDERTAYRTDVVGAMDEHSVDALLYPTWSNPPAHLDKGREEYKGDNSQNLAPSTGLPAITVPMGFSYGNLPAGLQMVARPYDEGTLFALAYAYEQATHHRRPPESFPKLEEGE